MAKSDVIVRMKADTSNYDANIAKARKQLDQFGKNNLTVGGQMKQLCWFHLLQNLRVSGQP